MLQRDSLAEMSPVGGNPAGVEPRSVDPESQPGMTEEAAGSEFIVRPATESTVDPAVEGDSELMLAYGLGVQGVFEKLYERHQRGLMHFFMSGTGDHATSLDLYQDTWARVIKNRQSYVATARFTTWFYTIARHVLIDHYRRSKGVILDSEHDYPEGGGDPLGELPLSPEEVAVLKQRTDDLQKALERLPLKQKEVILLRHIAGMSLAEICTATGDEHEAVKSRLRYAVAALRQYLRVVV